jgi:nucleoside-diphosphate-sugar epimerase
VAALRERGESVRIADDFSTGLRENVPSGVEVIEGDLAEPRVAERAVAGCEFVLHQAAIPSVPRSVKDPVASNRANVDATLQVLVAARNARARRVVYAGSSSAYGDTPVLPKREDMPPAPKSPYALQKLVGEQYCRLFTELYGLETVTTRYFNVYGPRQQPGSPYSGVISLFIEAAVEGRQPTVHGDGRQTRDFTFVEDVAQAVLACSTAPGVAGEVINLAPGGRISLLELLDTLGSIVERPVVPVFAPAREGDVRDSQADPSKAIRLIGFSPKVTLRDGLERTLNWYRSQR